MGLRERWVDNEEAEQKSPIVVAVLKIIHTTSTALVSGKG